eukprot:Nk52_evm9s1315 gene=Nk52_evmTU9s1315
MTSSLTHLSARMGRLEVRQRMTLNPTFIISRLGVACGGSRLLSSGKNVAEPNKDSKKASGDTPLKNLKNLLNKSSLKDSRNRLSMGFEEFDSGRKKGQMGGDKKKGLNQKVKVTYLESPNKFSCEDVGKSFFNVTKKDFERSALQHMTKPMEEYFNSLPEAGVLLRPHVASVLEAMGLRESNGSESLASATGKYLKGILSAYNNSSESDTGNKLNTSVDAESDLSKVILYYMENGYIDARNSRFSLLDGYRFTAQNCLMKKIDDFYKLSGSLSNFDGMMDSISRNKFLLVGPCGNGASLSLLNIVVAAQQSTSKNFITLYFPRPQISGMDNTNILKAKPIARTLMKDGLYRTPAYAVDFMQRLFERNRKFFEKANIVTSEVYNEKNTGNVKINIPAGTPILDLAKTYARNVDVVDDVLAIALREVAIQKEHNVLVAIDDITQFLHEHSDLKDEKKAPIPLRKLHFVDRMFKTFLDNDSEINASKNVYVVATAEPKRVDAAFKVQKDLERKRLLADPLLEPLSANPCEFHSFPWHLHDTNAYVNSSLRKIFRVQDPKKLGYTVVDVPELGNEEIISLAKYYASKGWISMPCAKSFLEGRFTSETASLELSELQTDSFWNSARKFSSLPKPLRFIDFPSHVTQYHSPKFVRTGFAVEDKERDDLYPTAEYLINAKFVYGGVPSSLHTQALIE